MNHDAYARMLHDARSTREPVETLTSREAQMTIEDAYAVQEAGIGLRLAEGERIVGGKLGFTSRAMQRAMDVHHPNYGWLTSAMVVHDGIVDRDRLIHPKVEPEIAFLLGDDLDPPVTLFDVLEATAAVIPCLEVVDSRYVGFRFGPLDNIADNSSAGAFTLGSPTPARSIALPLVGVVVESDGHLYDTAAGAAALDHPAAAVAWMVNNNRSQLRLKSGDLVISGGLTSPVDLHHGCVVTADFDRLGTVTIKAA
jgi:2-oxo-3-hexenedioate decarboxylase